MKNVLKCLFMFSLFLIISCAKEKVEKKPNILFVMMDDLGYGQFGVYNDTITTVDFNPFFVKLVDSLQGYSLDKSLEFSKTAIPTLTTLAKDGILFTNAYTSSNICAPSRLGIATGTVQNRFGVYTNTDCEGSGLVQGTHLAEGLKKQGYHTAHIGKWHIGKHDKSVITDILKANGLDENIKVSSLKTSRPDVYKQIRNSGYLGSVVNEQHPLNNGFDYYFGYNYWASQFYNSTIVWEDFKHAGKQQGYNTDVFTDKALKTMESSIKEQKPFYVQLHYHAVHDSLEPKAPEKYYNRFNSDSHDLNNFYGHVYGVDHNMNRIVEFLKSKNEYENTIIVFTSDNGAMAGGSYNGHKTGSPLPANAPFQGHKGNFHQGGIRVPLFIHWPKGVKESKISNKLVSTMDILPTALDVAKAKIPAQIDGESLLPLVLNENEKPVHDYLIWSGIQSYKWGFLINKSTKTHATEPPFAPPSWLVIKDGYLLRYTGVLEKGVYLEHLDGRQPILELFNIKNDPFESFNIIEEHPVLVKEMADLYFEDSKSFQPPSKWKTSKWKELQKENYLKLLSK